MKIKFTFFLLIIFLSLVMGRPSNALNPALLQKLLMQMSKGSDDALKHGDEVLKQSVPNPGTVPTPTPPSDSLNLGGVTARTSKNYTCSSSKNFPNAVEILVVTGNDVNIRACNSTKCSVIGRIKKGRYKVDAIKRENCWVDFQFKVKDGKQFHGFIFEKYASVE